MPQRKPYTPGREAAGEPTAGMPPMGPQPGRMGPQPPQMMGGNPGMQGAPAGAPMPGGPQQPPPPGGTQGMIGPSGHPQPQAGGPMAPGNIGQMLQAQVQPQQPPQQAVGTLGPWGDQGTRPTGASVNRAPFDPAALAPDALDPMGGDDPLAAAGAPGGLPPGALMGLMRKLGRI